MKNWKREGDYPGLKKLGNITKWTSNSLLIKFFNFKKAKETLGDKWRNFNMNWILNDVMELTLIFLGVIMILQLCETMSSILGNEW